MISIPLVFSRPYPCSYLASEIARPVFVNPTFTMTAALYAQLIQQGFRRSGNDVYAPRCPDCAACLPARVPVNGFVANRSQKRCRQKNHLTQVRVKVPEFSPEQYQLYLRYQQARHADGIMTNSSPDEYISFLSSKWCETVFIEFSIDDRVVALAVVDVFHNALSAVYTFFDPEYSAYGLGVYAILWQLDWAKSLQKKYVYLGFWVKDCEKMSYKNSYQPLEIYVNQQWQPYEKVFG